MSIDVLYQSAIAIVYKSLIDDVLVVSCDLVNHLQSNLSTMLMHNF